MIVLDTDIFTLFTMGEPRVVARVETAADVVAITVISRIEILRGRFDFLLKAADSEQLQRAQQLLVQSERDLADIPVLLIDALVAAEFDRLHQIKKLKKIGRADLLIASLVLAHRAVLVTRNLRHFQQVPRLLVEDWAK